MLALLFLLFSIQVLNDVIYYPYPQIDYTQYEDYDVQIPITFNLEVFKEISEVLIEFNTKKYIEENRMLESCEDVKFMQKNISLLYYEESGCNTERTQFWVRLEKAPQGETNITMHLGNVEYYYDLKRNRQWAYTYPIIFMDMDEQCPSTMPALHEYYANRYVAGASNKYFGVGGSSNHRHLNPQVYPETGVVSEIGDSIPLSGVMLGNGTWETPQQYVTAAHTHALNMKIAWSSKTPVSLPNYECRICSMNGYYGGLDIPENGIVISESKFNPENDSYVPFTEANGYFLSVTNNNERKIEPAVEHRHYQYSSSYGAATSDITLTSEAGDSAFFVKSDHTHYINQQWSDYETPMPPYMYYNFWKANRTTIPFEGMILMQYYGLYDPPIGWEHYLDLTDKLFMGGDYDGITHGSSTHHHNLFSGTTKVVDAEFVENGLICLEDCDNQVNGSSVSHIHTYGATISGEETSFPLHIKANFLKRKPSDGSEVNIRFEEQDIISYNCFLVSQNTSEVCGGHGECIEINNCTCEEDYYGYECKEYITIGEYIDSKTIEISYGIDTSIIESSDPEKHMVGEFNCSHMIDEEDLFYYEETKCYWIAETLLHTRTLVVKNPPHDEFTSLRLKTFTPVGEYDKIIEIPIRLYRPIINEAEKNEVITISGIWAAILFPLMFLFICCFVCGTCCICFCVYCFICVCCVSLCPICCTVYTQGRKLKRFGKIRNVDILLKEQELEEDVSIAHLRIDQTLFEIKFDDITILDKLGEGGSQSVIYRCEWHGRVVAFKCFKTRDICSKEETFEEFEKEVEILASVNHPNILQFYGAILNPPRVGIVVEFCANKDLKCFLIRYHDRYRRLLDLKEKLRILQEISHAMEYLHDRKIIHRDLKMENVLITKSMESRVMDFGLSKVVDSMQDDKTKRVGTSFFMAPEVVCGEQYDEKCDVFSFSIVLYMTITEIFLPYGKHQFDIEFKVANNPSFRPKVRKATFDKLGAGWIVPLIQNCWSHDPKDRPGFAEIVKDLVEENKKLKPKIPQRSYKMFSRLSRLRKESGGTKSGRPKELDKVVQGELMKKNQNLEEELESLEEKNKRVREKNAYFKSLMRKKGMLLEAPKLPPRKNSNLSTGKPPNLPRKRKFEEEEEEIEGEEIEIKIEENYQPKPSSLPNSLRAPAPPPPVHRLSERPSRIAPPPPPPGEKPEVM